MDIKISQDTYSQNFTGKVYTKGHWPKEIKKAFLSSFYLQTMTEGYDVFAHIKSKNDYDAFIPSVSKIYKIYIGKYKDNSHFNWLRDLFNVKKRIGLTNNYHSVNGTISSFNAPKFYDLQKNLTK